MSAASFLVRLMACSLAAVSLMAAASASARGQVLELPDDSFTAAPPVDPAIGADGVDAVSGAHTQTSPSIAIGDSSAGGLTYVQIHQGDASRHNLSGGINEGATLGEVVVSLFGASEVFGLISGVYVADRANGASLAEASGEYTYTGRDGTVAIFSGLTSGDAEVLGFDRAYLSEVEFPSGRTLRFTYQSSTVDGDVVRRLQSVTNNHGYQIHFEYDRLSAATTQTQLESWLRLDHVRAINNAVEGCSPGASACTLTEDWPRLDIGYPSANVRTYTDNLNRETRWTFDSLNRLTGVRQPGDTVDTLQIAYDTAGRVHTITRGPLTWTHAAVDNAGVRSSSVTHPGGAVTTTEVTLSTGLVSAEIDARGERTQFLYDSDARITRITAPEGDYVAYTYDGRGNVTQMRPVRGSPIW